MKNVVVKYSLLCVISVIMFVICIFGLSSCSSKDYVNNSYTIDEDFESISIDTETADVVFIKSEDGRCRVECFEHKNMKHSASVSNGTLNIKGVDTRKWHQKIFGGKATSVTVYLPDAAYKSLVLNNDTGDVTIHKDFSFDSIDISASTGNISCFASASGEVNISLSTGNINIENITAGSLSLSCSTGDITVSNVNCLGDVNMSLSTGDLTVSSLNCKNFTADGSTGNKSLNSVIASEKLKVTSSTGDINFNSCDASEIYMESSTGDIKGSFLTEKIIFAETDTGKHDVPKCTTGERCDITTSTGDIKITIG